MTQFTVASNDTAATNYKYGQAVASIVDEINSYDSDLWKINQEIHNNPELGYQEFKAHDKITAMLETMGFNVTRHAFELPTAFLVELGSEGRVVAFNAEYDALPEIGHACGHNLIATISIAAFIGMARAMKESKLPGRIRLYGTPAEEGGGGKLKLINAGAYKDVDACMMIHPGPEDESSGFTGDAYMPTAANHKFNVRFYGKAAHAAMAPWQGCNALDAVVLAYNAISALRQQMQPTERIHCIISDGGERPNIIAAFASLQYYIRAPTLKEADDLRERAKNCFTGAALATGCKVDINTYSDVRPNRTLALLYRNAMVELGSPVRCDFKSAGVPGSTDMGNVTYECPGIHGYVGIPAEPGAYNHTPGFTAAAATRQAHTLSMATSKGMAIAGWQVLTNDEVAASVQKDFELDKQIRSRPRYAMYAAPTGGCC
ncbi:hypothetical protein BP5796_04300 [Coleophoma crateriformis]|uniref:Peptidase M20 domain-containing protein 2 n=1 Tax=Coleophoma crateriformis TaxID=565419 RepID=A0A3D8SHZ6_9HELO|nr:hypothetical protein BP5796_04300 [Coleophoma crateriformis]